MGLVDGQYGDELGLAGERGGVHASGLADEGNASSSWARWPTCAVSRGDGGHAEGGDLVDMAVELVQVEQGVPRARPPGC